MEKSVGQRIDVQPGHRCYGMSIDIADRVVLLQDLVQGDAVDETTETKPEQ